MSAARALIVVILCLFVRELFADDAYSFIAEGAKTETLTLDEAIGMALKNNLDIRWNRSALQEDRDRVRLAWGTFDPALNINISRESIRTPQNAQQFVATGGGQDLLAIEQIQLEEELLFQQSVTQAILNGQVPPTRPPSSVSVTGSEDTRIFEEENFRLQTAIEGRTPLGTRYSLGLRADRLDNTLNRAIPPSLFHPEWSTFAGLTITQPLLRDFGPAANLADVRIARKNKEISRLTWESKILTAVQTVMGTYYDMLLGYETVRSRQDAVSADQKLAHENQRRLDLGMMSPIDVRQAEVAVSVDQENLITAKNFFMDRQFQLKRQILNELKTEDSRILLPLGSLDVVAPRLDRAELMKEAFRHRLDYQEAMKEAEIQNIRLQFAKNQLWPRLDLVSTFGYNGLSSSFDSSLSRGFDGQAPQWSIGFQASVPLGNLQGRAQLDVVKRLKEQSIIKLKQVELGITLDVDTVISRIESSAQSVETSRQSRRLAEEAVKIQNRRIEEGLISSFDALETQKKLYDARARELQAMADLNKSLVQLWVSTGTLLQKLAITVEE